MIKRDFVCTILVYVLTFCAIIMPWYTNGQYNQDLLVIVVYLKTVFEDSSFSESFLDNMTVVYLLRNLLPNVSPYSLVFLLHNISVLLLTFVLRKFLKPIYVCSIMFFCFFTVFCNQFRLAFALAFGILGFMTYFKNKYIGVFIILSSLLFHFFVASFIMGILLLDILNRSSKKIKFLIIVLIVLIFGLFYNFVINNPRYLLYLIKEDSGFVSNTWLPVGCALIIMWRSIDKSKLFLVLAIYSVVVISAPLPNISSRVGELLFIIMLLFSKYALNNNWKFICKGHQLTQFHSYLYFGIGLTFFIYRFVNWVILDNVISPEILNLL